MDSKNWCWYGETHLNHPFSLTVSEQISRRFLDSPPPPRNNVGGKRGSKNARFWKPNEVDSKGNKCRNTAHSLLIFLNIVPGGGGATVRRDICSDTRLDGFNKINTPIGFTLCFVSLRGGKLRTSIAFRIFKYSGSYMKSTLLLALWVTWVITSCFIVYKTTQQSTVCVN